MLASVSRDWYNCWHEIASGVVIPRGYVSNGDVFTD